MTEVFLLSGPTVFHFPKPAIMFTSFILNVPLLPYIQVPVLTKFLHNPAATVLVGVAILATPVASAFKFPGGGVNLVHLIETLLVVAGVHLLSSMALHTARTPLL